MLVTFNADYTLQAMAADISLSCFPFYKNVNLPSPFPYLFVCSVAHWFFPFII